MTIQSYYKYINTTSSSKASLKFTEVTVTYQKKYKIREDY